MYLYGSTIIIMSLDNDIHEKESESYAISTKYFIYHASLHRNNETLKFCIF